MVVFHSVYLCVRQPKISLFVVPERKFQSSSDGINLVFYLMPWGYLLY